MAEAINNPPKPPRPAGYYWVLYPIRGGNSSPVWTVGYYGGSTHPDGSKNTHPWEFVGSDYIFEESEVIAAIPLEIPPGVEPEVRYG